MSDVDINRVRNWALAYQRLMLGGLAAEAHTACVDDFANDEGEFPFITAADVLTVLDRLQAAEDAVERVRAELTDAENETLAGGRLPNVVHVEWIRDALDGRQDAATGEVALGVTDEPREPQIAVQVCDHPGIDHDVVWSYCRRCPKCGVCKFIGHGPLCFDCYSASGAEGDHGGRGDGEGLG